jgi:hypothetical protein
MLAAFRAEALLENQPILDEIAQLVKDLRYNTDGEVIAFDDYFERLHKDVQDLPRLALQSDLAPGEDTQYTLQLITTMQQVYDDCDRVRRKIIRFETRLLSAKDQIAQLAATFGAWYILAANQIIETNELKFPAVQVKQLATAEFSRLMDHLDIKVNSLLMQVEAENIKVKEHKATQKEKFTMGKTQADLSYASNLPNYGEAPDNSSQLTEEQEPEEEDGGDVPAFVTRRPVVGNNPMQAAVDAAKPGDTVVFEFKENVAPTIAAIKDKLTVSPTTTVEITVDPVPDPAPKGTFHKTLPAKPVSIIHDDGGPIAALDDEPEPARPPRKHLVFDDDEEI